MAARLGISVSYLSQLESDDRPITHAVPPALGAAFPRDWAEIDAERRRRAALVRADARRSPIRCSPTRSPPEPRPAARCRSEQPGARRPPDRAPRRRSRAAEERLRDRRRGVGSDAGGGRRLPWEEVRDWFHDAGNYVDPIDRAAERLAALELRPSPAPRWRRVSVRGTASRSPRATTGGAALRALRPGDARCTLDAVAAAGKPPLPARPPARRAWRSPTRSPRIVARADVALRGARDSCSRSGSPITPRARC